MERKDEGNCVYRNGTVKARFHPLTYIDSYVETEKQKTVPIDSNRVNASAKLAFFRALVFDTGGWYLPPLLILIVAEIRTIFVVQMLPAFSFV